MNDYPRKLVALAVLVIVGSLSRCTPATPAQSVSAADTSAKNGDACPHGIRAEQCPFCTPSLIESSGVCAEHGVPEALCYRCRSFLKAAFQAKGDWCAAHDAPESQCPICNPDFAKAQAGIGAPLPPPRPSVAPSSVTNGRRSSSPPSSSCTKSSTLVRFQSPEIARTAGLAFATAEERPLTFTITRNAEVAYNGNRYARLASRASGVIADVRRDLGDPVAAGDVLAVVDSPELGSAKADLLQANAAVELWKRAAARERSLAERGIGAERDAFEAETKEAEGQIAVAKARQRLHNLGLSDDQIAAAEQAQDTSSQLRLVAPFDGVIAERSAVLGEVVESTTPLFTVANTETMWAMIDLTESDVTVVQPGQDALLAVDGLPGEMFGGRVTWVSTHLNPATRTLKARAEIANDGGLIRANTFAKVHIVARRGEQALVIPRDSVQWDGCCNVVFVRVDDTATAFQPKKVHLGIATDGVYEVLAGLQPGEVVVTTGSYLLKTEILKGSIGAGCCDVEHLSK